MAVKLVVFDMAGTTVKDNDNVHQSLINAFRLENIEVTRDEANKVMGYPKPIAIKQLLHAKLNGSLQKSIHEYEFIDKIHKNFISDMVHFYLNHPDVREKEGASSTFKELKKRNIKVVTDTGFDRNIANAILKRLGWQKDGLIDASVTSDEVPNGRPYPDMIFKAMNLAKVKDSREVVKVGDTASDLLQGNKAGCGMVVGITSGAFKEEELKVYPHTHLISQLPELLDLIDQ